MQETDLSAAVSQGNLELVRSLLDMGANIRYVRPHGYTAMIDVMHGRLITDDDQLIPILRLLIDCGADLNAESSYGESGLSVASNMGRFDAVEVLLDAGADPAPLNWTPLLRAVALGSVDDVRLKVKMGDDLAARDRWERTPWLLSLQAGDIAKAELLLAAGANPSDRGRCGKTPLMYPIINGHTSMLKWLLQHGEDANETDDFGTTALVEAAGTGAADCVRMLLDVGANVHHNGGTGTAIQAASNMAVVRLLTGAGADINDISGELRAALTRLPSDGAFACTLEDYQNSKHRTFGTANPHMMNYPFWKAMVMSGASGYHARQHFEKTSGYGKAVWCFSRFGKSLTELPDGRIIEIAGEHEDSYDPDFCIYNDVIVHSGDGTFDIYGYPKTVFPPTDFHSATLVGNLIYIIGSLGYREERQYGMTPVYRLDIETLAIKAIRTSGSSPGWINSHKAQLVTNGIEIFGGKVCSFADGKELYEDNTDSYVLDLTTKVWSRSDR